MDDQLPDLVKAGYSDDFTDRLINYNRTTKPFGDLRATRTHFGTHRYWNTKGVYEETTIHSKPHGCVISFNAHYVLLNWVPMPSDKELGAVIALYQDVQQMQKEMTW
jgi:hypothetical protein